MQGRAEGLQGSNPVGFKVWSLESGDATRTIWCKFVLGKDQQEQPLQGVALSRRKPQYWQQQQQHGKGSADAI